MKEQKPMNGNGAVQGEGDYKSVRRYKHEVETFIEKKGDEIPSMAKDAEQAIDGPEAEELKKAEEKGKSKARH